MRKITIVIESGLTPFHEQSMLGFVNAAMKGISHFWKEKSVKHFSITIDGMSMDEFKIKNNLD